jgi:hypothetical protein
MTDGRERPKQEGANEVFWKIEDDFFYKGGGLAKI